MFFQLMQIFFQTFIRKHLYLGIWYHIHRRLPVISFRALRPYLRVQLEEKNLGTLFFLLKNHLYLKNIYYFIFFLSVTSGLRFRTRGSTPLSKRLPEL